MTVGLIAGERPENTATSIAQCRSQKVSARSLPKTGILREGRGDFPLFLAQVAILNGVETRRIMQESLYFAGFLRYSCELS
jgi:hypothetical protein